MNLKMLKGSVLWVLAGGLAACSTTPAYPTGSNQAPPASVKPRYAIDPPPQAAPSQVVAEQAQAPVTAAPTPVQSTPLAPISSSPAPTPPPIEPAPASKRAAPESAKSPTLHPAPTRYGATGRVVEPHGMYRDYVVQRHDHLYAIARDLQTTPQILIKANHLKNPEHLKPGQHLKAPVEKAYVVQAGDTIALVARRFSLNSVDLADLNDLSERARLRPGDQLALPADFHDRGPVELSSPRLATTPNYRIYATPPPGTAGASATAPNTTPPMAEAAGPALSDAQIAALAHNRFVWPVRGEIISGFGSKGLGVSNDGVDLRAVEGSVVRAAASGDVVYAGNQIQGFGNLVLLQHADGWVTAYAHLQHMSVQMRQQVAQGQEIGAVGTSGGVGEPQLHFEVRYKGSPGEKARPIDPVLVLPPS